MCSLMKNSGTALLAIIFCTSLVLAPPIVLPFFNFKFQFVDFLMPILLGIIIYKRWIVNWRLNYVIMLLCIIPIIIVSIIINKQFSAINDYFEIYRIITFILVFIFFKETYNSKWFGIIWEVIFVLLLILNLFHFHNILNFNQFVMPIYCGSENYHLTHFGLNSLMQPATKRMLGLLANPNNNAILFILFTIRFLPKHRWNTKEMIFFFLGLIAILACQSRTGFLAFAVVFFTNYIISKISWKQMVVQILSVFLISWLFLTYSIFDYAGTNNNGNINTTSDYLLTLTGGEAFTSSSVKGRLQIWKELTQQILQKPVFGHSPRKNYFYENKLYAENGYILWTWRYGIVGLIAFVSIFLLPVKKIFNNIRSTIEAKHFLLVIITFLITNLTNSPLSHTTLSLLFFIFAGVFYNQINLPKNEPLIQNNS